MTQYLDLPRQFVQLVPANYGGYCGPDTASPHTILQASLSSFCVGSCLSFVGCSRYSTTLAFGISSLDVSQGCHVLTVSFLSAKTHYCRRDGRDGMANPLAQDLGAPTTSYQDTA